MGKLKTSTGRRTPHQFVFLPSRESFKMYEREMFLAELTHLYAIYEKLVYSLVSFPKSGMVNQMVLDMVDRFAEDMELIGNSPSDLQNYIDVSDPKSPRVSSLD
jgi:hypothetical protein